ncbi:ferritin [Saprospira grandis]|uniref:Ferritin n=1 Tax=Saprospira grandis (strain Lewin) TaxID=984262 RepID=H6L2T1_SAPGL|nr:ferritin [Saprospira grandis]AFC24838.1 ferritin 1 [Saprospira grandis str. Lewin]WBM76229.1 ferritin [Saprospira grandis]
MLSKKITAALNAQIAQEAAASSAYLAMASWCDREGLGNCAQFFYAQSDEERMHMLKIVHYVNEMDGHAIVPAVEQPETEFESVQKVFKKSYKQEKAVTASINELMSLSQEEKDHSTMVFLQWYVAEQREEEAMVRDILDKIKLIGDGPQSLYYIDKELQQINENRPAEEAEA